MLKAVTYNSVEGTVKLVSPTVHFGAGKVLSAYIIFLCLGNPDKLIS